MEPIDPTTDIARLSELLHGIAHTAQAGTIGDAAAIEVAFALIARQAIEASDLLARIDFDPSGVKRA